MIADSTGQKNSLPGVLAILAVLAGGAAPAACGEDGPTAIDAATSNPDTDSASAAAGDATSGAESDATGGFTCRQVYECRTTCGLDPFCHETCKKKACAAAANLFAELQVCADRKCFLQCLPAWASLCQNCLAVSCANELGACSETGC